jgi:hypothetical protein
MQFCVFAYEVADFDEVSKLNICKLFRVFSFGQHVGLVLPSFHVSGKSCTPKYMTLKYFYSVVTTAEP